MTDTSAASPSAPSGAWSIGPRVLPPPAGASEELRTLLAKSPAPVPLPNPDTDEDWKAMIAKWNGNTLNESQSWAEKFGVRVEPDTVAGVGVYRITPPEVAPEHAQRLFVYAHGGAFFLNAGLAGTAEAVQIAGKLKMPALSIDYRQAPDHSAPAAMEDVVAVWREVTKDRDASRVALGGTSGGANLTLVTTLRLKDLGLELPGALFVGTPAADFAKRGDSRFINEGIDSVVVDWDGLITKAGVRYAGGKSYEDPYLSPIYGDFSGFPPSYLISGTRDLLLSDTVRVHRKLRQAGVTADLHVYEGIAHGQYYILMGTPESDEHYAEFGAFLDRHLKR